MHGTVSFLFKLIGALTMLAMLLVAWSVYRLGLGPLSLSPLTPILERTLSRSAPDLSVSIGDTILNWSRSDRSLAIEAVAVQLRKNGALLANFPEMSLRLSGRALLRGKIVPQSIRLSHPTLHLVRDPEGLVTLGISEPGGEPASGLGEAELDSLLAPPGPENLAGQLQNVQIQQGALIIEDRQSGASWTVPRADLSFSRDQQGINLSSRLDLLLDGQEGHVTADGSYHQRDRSIDLTLSGGLARPAILAELDAKLAPLAALQMPLDAKLALHYQLGAGLRHAGLDLTAGEGQLDLTASAGFAIRLKSLSLHGDYDPERLQLSGVRLDLGGLVLSADALLDDLKGSRKLTAKLRSDGVALDQLAGLWPKFLAPNPRAWVTSNLTNGRIGAVEANFLGHLPADGDLSLDGVSGSMRVTDATVRYIPSMPLIHHVDGEVSFDQDRFVIGLNSGEADGLTIENGEVLLLGLSTHEQDAEIKLTLNGSTPDMLRFIDHPPLGWTHKFGLDPEIIKGDSHLKLAMGFPLIDRLTLDELKIKADADLSNLLLPHIYQGLDLAEASLHLHADNKGLDGNGNGQIDQRPASLQWRENFDPRRDKAPFQSRFQVTASLSEEGRQAAGLAIFRPPYVSGVLGVTLDATMLEPGRWDIGVTADLAAAELALPDLNYRKPSGVKGRAGARLLLNDNKIIDLPDFSLAAEDHLAIQGAASFDREGAIRRLLFNQASFARNDLKGTIDFRKSDGGLTVTMNGGGFDAREIIAGRRSDPVTDRAPPKLPHPPVAHPKLTEDQPLPELIPLTISGRFGRVWLSDDGAISNVALELTRDRQEWRKARLNAELGDHHALTLVLAARDSDQSDLSLDCDDAGALFRALDIFDTIRGGKLRLAAVLDDRLHLRPITGDLTVSDFQLADAPILARLLTVAGLTGIVDLMSGQGIHFAKLEAPFTLKDGILQLHDGEAAGSALGMTAKGEIDLDNQSLALEGTVVPAYAINSALGGLPLVGGLFSSEKGGGVLALNYRLTGPMDDPSTSVNPLSALTPGFMRHLFDIFDTKPAPKSN